MSSAKVAPSISSNLGTWIGLILSTAKSTMVMRVLATGPLSYILSWLMWPLFNMIFVAYLYHGNADLRNYAIVASSGHAILMGLVFNSGEMLDGARRQGFLGTLFLSPLPRYVWIGGYQLVALLETTFNAVMSVGLGVIVFGVDLDVNLPSLLVTLALMTIALWGASMILSSIGLYTRNANFLSNLVMPFMTLLSGSMYPVDRMPDWIRIPARLLPFAYGNEALFGALTRDASIASLDSKLLPLAVFAIILPALGIAMFRRAERSVRRWGTLELV